MARFKIPQQQAETPVQSGDTPFPEGVFRGVIDEIRVQAVHRGAGEGPEFILTDRDGNVLADNAVVASIQIGSNEPELEGGPEVGERKFFDDLLVLDMDKYSWDQPVEDEPSWRLDQTRRRLTNLALALDLVESDEEGVGPIDNFDDLLRNGELEGMEVVFEVAHRKVKRDGETRVYPFLKAYMPAV